MLDSLKHLFSKLVPPADEAGEHAAEQVLQLACAVLIAEVIAADTGVDARERSVMLKALHERFGLAGDEAKQLASLAETTARDSHDLYEFTSHINAQFGMPQKLRMLEMLWRVAYADASLGDPERQVVRRIADLMKVPQGASAGIRDRVARESAAGGG